MKMKKLLLLLLFIPLVSFGQSLRSINLDSYKYIVVSESNYNSLRKTAVKFFEIKLSQRFSILVNFVRLVGIN